MGKRVYRVDYEIDEASGYWVAVIDRSQGVSIVTQARSLSLARKRVRDALELWFEDAKAAQEAVLVDNVKLPAKLGPRVRQCRKAREIAEVATTKAQSETAHTVKQLTAAGLSRRDAAEVLGISFQRVQQLAEGS